jgi:1-deoxy-D-xylulose-5-phosphate reductoisomerase
VAAFLENKIGFDEIPRIIEDTVSASNSGKLESIAKVLEADAEARRYAQERVLGISKKTVRPRATSVV